ncbi:MAG: sulfite exporter TauE/SafE family protein [Spirochaetales bacterium]|nr:sulfite exporter TauE/SafE family protein [Spirochaetales bacterium]
MFSAFITGLSTGLYCVTTCLPLILPFSLSEDRSQAGRIRSILLFMAGRLVGYVTVGIILGQLGAFAVSYLNPHTAIILKRISYPVAGIILLAAGLLYGFPHLKFCSVYKKIYKPEISAAVLGIVTAFSLCPPFFAAAARAFGEQSTISGGMYFFIFFLGTSVWFLPLFGAGYLNRVIKPLRIISRTAMILIGGYYLIFMGILGSF